MNATGEALNQISDGSKKRRSGRSGGKQNYSEHDIHVLLDIVDKNVPIGKNDWSRVTTEYNKYAVEKDRSTRDLEGLRIKFDRLAATKKPTGDPSCPENVRRAKRISHDIYNLAYAATVGDSGEDEDEDLATDDAEDSTVPLTESPSFLSSSSTPVLERDSTTGQKRRNHAHIGARKKARNNADVVCAGLSSMAKSVGRLVDVLACSGASGNDASTSPNTHITEIEQLRNDVNQLNPSMADLKDMMKTLLNRS